jgi:hypothetical protein
MAEQIVTEVEYRDIPGFEGYRVGSDGSVWSRRNINGVGLVDRWRKIKSCTRPNGYLHVTIAPLGQPELRRKLSVHRLVLEVFVGSCPEGMEACHRNDIPEDNRLKNLRWGTKLDNHNDRRLNDMIPMGTRHYKARLNESDVKMIRYRRERGDLLDDIAGDFGVTKQCVLAIFKRRIWKHVA